MEPTAPNESSFPAKSRSTRLAINDHDTSVTTISFADKLLFTITQNGSLAHWVHVPLSASSDAQIVQSLDSADSDTTLLPTASLTATTVLGGTRQEDEVLGQTLATMIASAVLLKHPEDARLLVVGMGILDKGIARKANYDRLIEALFSLI